SCFSDCLRILGSCYKYANGNPNVEKLVEFLLKDYMYDPLKTISKINEHIIYDIYKEFHPSDFKPNINPTYLDFLKSVKSLRKEPIYRFFMDAPKSLNFYNENPSMFAKLPVITVAHFNFKY